MNTQQDTVTLTILGKEYKIVCEVEEQDELFACAQQLDMQMRKIRDSGKINGADRIAVMVALNLAHELHQEKQQNQILRQQLDGYLAGLNHKLENILENP